MLLMGRPAQDKICRRLPPLEFDMNGSNDKRRKGRYRRTLAWHLRRWRRWGKTRKGYVEPKRMQDDFAMASP
jgi:hypothetical protein